MPEYFTKRLPLFIVLIIFIVCKIPQLQYAYYWDECKPYAVAINDMYHHGASLVPGAIDPEVSRGHPMLFHASAALWMNIFGTSHISVHSFALFISLLLLIMVYEAGMSLFNQRVAILVLLLVATQEMFFVQSSMALPEVMVAMLCFASLIFYVKEKYFLTALSLTMLFYTKESGLVMGALLGADAVIRLFDKKGNTKQKIYRLLATGVPAILIALFFVIQKNKLGWYLFPEHIKMMGRSWESFWYTLRIGAIRSEFHDGNRFYYFFMLVFVAIIAAITQKKPILLTIALPVICICYLVDELRSDRLLPGIPFFIIFIFSTLFFLLSYPRDKYFLYGYQKRLVVLCGFFVFCYLCFCAVNFFTPRYCLASLVPVFFIVAVVFDMLINYTYRWLFYPVAIGILVISLSGFITSESYGDCEIGSYDALAVQQDVADYFEHNVPTEEMIATGSNLTLEHLHDPATGFLHSKNIFKNIKWEIEGHTHYTVFDNIQVDPRHDNMKKDTNFQLVYKIEKGKMWGEVYKRK